MGTPANQADDDHDEHDWLEGTLEKIRFANDDKTWSIAVVREEPEAKGRYAFSGRESTVVGNLCGAQPGQQVRIKGRWTMHAKFGRQFEIAYLVTSAPVNAQGITRYLSSGLVKGIGPGLAKRLVAHFGDATLDVIDNQPERLSEVAGIGKVRIQRITAAWTQQRAVRDIMVFLQSHGATPAYATRIYKTYGEQAIAKVQHNPYALARDVHGIGFKLADRIANKLGFQGDDPKRVRAGVLHVLAEAQHEGHLYLPEAELEQRASAYLHVHADHIKAAIEALTFEQRLFHEPVSAQDDPEGGGHLAVYPRGAWEAELACAEEFERILGGLDVILGGDDVDISADTLAAAEADLGVTLAPKQREAITRAIEQRVLVITGGPGTGKTTIVRAVCAIADALGWDTTLAAPTGRAARRMSEATDQPAQTLHRLLEFSFKAGGFQRNHDNPIEGDLIVVDEASMIDIYLMRALLRAVPTGASLLLVGDVDQLPSVGPGDVLAELIRSEVIPVCRLDSVFRQAAASAIVRNAHRINQGQAPDRALPANPKDTDFFLIPARDADDVLAKTLKVVTERVPAAFGFDPNTDVQVIAPMHKGIVGCQRLNRELQARLNGHEERHLQRGHNVFKVGDRIMQIRNNYTKEVFNGDIGHVVNIEIGGEDDEPGLIVRLDDRRVRYEIDELDELTLAYSITAHKSQGSEYPVVVIALATAHYVLLERNLLYTALTRARKLAIIITMGQALKRAVTNVTSRTRRTRLAARLRQLRDAPRAAMPAPQPTQQALS